MADVKTFELYWQIKCIRPVCPITGRIGTEIHHALIERGFSGLPRRDQGVIHVPWNCVLLTKEGHDRLHGVDPKLNQICIRALIAYYGVPYIEEQIKNIPFNQKTSLQQILARNGLA